MPHRAIKESISPEIRKIQPCGVVIALDLGLDANLEQLLADGLIYQLGVAVRGRNPSPVQRTCPSLVSGFLQRALRAVRIIGEAFQLIVVAPDTGGDDAVFTDALPLIDALR